jgi:hypothetical protein
MIIGTWTAFEVMASDLWETALNEHPKKLASLSSANGKMEKVIELYELEKAGYDLSRTMGTVFKQGGKFNFQSLAGIREAYTTAFRIDKSAVEEAITDKALDALSLTRNILVHRSGKIDDKFRMKAADIPLLSKWIGSESVKLDGGDVTTFINPVLGCSFQLIKAVDDWLTTHP